jgi:hypothetical protein
MLAAHLAGFTQIAKHAARTIDATTGVIGIANQAQQAAALDLAIRLGLIQPLIEAAACHF